MSCDRSPSPIRTTPIPGTSFSIFGRFLIARTSSHMITTSTSPSGLSGQVSARYWGISQPDYYKRADTWPLNPEGEVLVVIMCEEVRAIKNLPKMLKEVPGIGVVLIGEGDLSQDMGYPRQYDHPEVAAAIDEALAICKEAGVPCGHPHVDSSNVEQLLEKGFRWLMPAPSQSFAALDKGLKASGRK